MPDALLGGLCVAGEIWVTMQAHLTLDLHFERSGPGYRVRVFDSPAGGGQSVEFGEVVTGLELENLALKIIRPNVRVRRQQPAHVAMAKNIGGRIFEAVFAGSVGECLRRSTDQAKAKGVPLWVRLRLSATPDLANWPWELLYDAHDDWFLALSGLTPLIRHTDLSEAPRPVAVSLPLRVLAIRSEAAGSPALDLAAEWSQVTAALTDLIGSGTLTITELVTPTLDELRRALLRDSFHVLHYMGHSAFDERHGGVLFFSDEPGRSGPVTAEDLGVYLRGHSSLRLAILNACEAGRSDPGDPFAGLADTLVRRGIPAVIAMQFEITDTAAIKFSPALYEALAAGKPIDAALAEARQAIRADSLVEWATPVLYLRGDDAQLFDITSVEPGRASDKDKASAYANEGARWQEIGLAAGEAAFRNAIALDPDLAKAFAGLGAVLYHQDRLSEAEAVLVEAIRLEPDSHWPHSDLANVLRKLTRFDESEAEFREAIRLNSDEFWPQHDLGILLRDCDRLEESEIQFRKSAELNRDCPRPHHELGRLYWQQKLYSQAEAEFREAIRLGPGNLWPHHDLALVLRDTGHPDEAELEFREAIRLDPDVAQPHYQLGALLRDLKRPADSEAEFSEALRLDPYDPWAHYDHGRLLRDQSQYPEAETEFRRAIRLNPSLDWPHYQLGTILRHLARPAEAEAELREAIRLGLANARTYNELGRVLCDLGRDAEAETEFRQALRLEPAKRSAHGNLVDLLRRQGRDDEAADAERQAAALGVSIN